MFVKFSEDKECYIGQESLTTIKLWLTFLNNTSVIGYYSNQVPSLTRWMNGSLLPTYNFVKWIYSIHNNLITQT